MRKFLKGRWHRIPVALISALLVLTIVAGGVFAAHMVFNGNANVTVVEAFTISNTGGDGGEEFTQDSSITWDVSLYPGESKSLNVLVSNASSAALAVSAPLAHQQGLNGITAGWTGSSNVPGGGSVVLTLTVTVAADAPANPTTTTIYLEFCRG